MGKPETAQFVMYSLGIGTLGYLVSGPLSDRFGRKIILSLYTLLGVLAVLVLNYLHSRPSVSFAELLIPGTIFFFIMGLT